MTPEETIRWKTHFTTEQRLTHIRNTASSLIRSYAKRRKALDASRGAPGFVVSSTGRSGRLRNGAHNTMGKRLQDALNACQNDMDDLRTMVNTMANEI